MPNLGYTFVKWEGEGISDQNSSLSLILKKDSNLTAYFELEKHQLSLSKTLGGTTSGTGLYDHGTVVQIIATPDEGFRFKEWTGEGISGISTPIFYVEVEKDKNLTATFEKEMFELKTTSNTGGSVEGAGIFEFGETVTVKAIPETGYKFVSWNGLEGKTEAESSIIMENNLTVDAVFQKITLSSLSSAKSIGSNWFEHWFGYFYENASGWAYHTEFGWIYLDIQNDESIWFWSENFSWLWVNESTRNQGLYWMEMEDGWIYFPLVTPTNKIYYGYNSEEWIVKTVSSHTPIQF